MFNANKLLIELSARKEAGEELIVCGSMSYNIEGTFGSSAHRAMMYSLRSLGLDGRHSEKDDMLSHSIRPTFVTRLAFSDSRQASR